MNDYKKLLSRTIDTLNYTLSERDDVFVTTSFGYQSALLFFLMEESGISSRCLFIKSNLAYGGIESQKDYLVDRFKLNIDVVNRSEWLEEQLQGDEFLELDNSIRSRICYELKREPLIDYIKENNHILWVSGIRRDQTDIRARTHFLNTTDLNVVKVAPLYAWSKSEVHELIRSAGLKVNDDYVDLCKINDSKECGLHL